MRKFADQEVQETAYRKVPERSSPAGGTHATAYAPVSSHRMIALGSMVKIPDLLLIRQTHALQDEIVEGDSGNIGHDARRTVAARWRFT